MHVKRRGFYKIGIELVRDIDPKLKKNLIIKDSHLLIIVT